MLQFILRRLGLVIPTFIGITLLTFAFVHMIPGDPVMIMAGERGISPERHVQLLAELGLDKPMWQQYLHYIWGVMHGDLGISMKSRIPVWEEFVPRFQATLELGVCAMIFATAVGIPVGVLAAVKRGSIFDHTAVGLALTGYSMPIFWWGMMLIMLVSVHWSLTPVSGRVSDMVFLDDSNPLTGFMLIDTAIWGEDGNFIDAVAHMILPAMAIACRPKLLIADEPTTALDVTIQAQIIELLLELQQKENMALVLITHDLALVAEAAHKIIVMYAGQVVETGDAHAIFHAPRHPYTQALLRALPEFAQDKERLASLPGVVPGKYDRPNGCLLNPRCPYATDRCRAEEPALNMLADGRQSKCHYPLDDAGRPTL